MQCKKILCYGDLPKPRYSFGFQSYKHMLILFGGYSSEYDFTDDLYFFDTKSKKWEQIKTDNDPPIRNSHTCCVVDDEMYLFGGYSVSYGYLNDLWILNLDYYKWKKLETNHSPNELANHTCVSFRENLIIFGGFNAIGLFNKVWSYNIYDQTWKLLNCSGEEPIRRWCHSACVSKYGIMYVFGGCALVGNSYVKLNDMYQLDLHSNIWKKITIFGNIPSPRQGHSILEFDNEILLFGGANTQYFNDLYSFNPMNQRWSKLPNMDIEPRKWFGMAPVRDNVYIFGGDGNDSSFNDLWRLYYSKFRNCIYQRLIENDFIDLMIKI
jgi:N-acetylneuraminic acid mutarotase